MSETRGMIGGSWQARTGVLSGRGGSLGRVSGLSGFISHQTVEGGQGGLSAFKLLWSPALPHPLEGPNPDTTSYQLDIHIGWRPR